MGYRLSPKILTCPGHGGKPRIFALKNTKHIQLLSNKNKNLTGN